MSLFVWLIIGGLAGKVIKRKGSGVVTNIVVGVIGAFLGGWVVSLMGGNANVLTGFNVSSFLTAFFGAVLLLLLLKAIRK